MSDRTEELTDQNADRLLEKANVNGVGGGRDRVIVFVTEKKPLNALSQQDVVDPEIDGIRTDVIEVGNIEPMNLNPGASIGISGAGTGTFGGTVVDEHGNEYLLTNNHVAANSNRALALTSIMHPGPADGSGSPIGKLARFEPIFFNKPNFIDAALIRSDVNLNKLPQSRTTTGRVGWSVKKTGRTTGLTTGSIIARNTTVDVNFGVQGIARFREQIVTDYMLAPGDSGSVLLSKSGYPVGLSFAGSDTISLHNPINIVLRTLGVKLA